MTALFLALTPSGISPRNLVPFTLLSTFALTLCSGCALPYTKKNVRGDLTSYEYGTYPDILKRSATFVKVKFPDLRLKTGETYYLSKALTYDKKELRRGAGRAPCLLWLPIERQTLLQYLPAKYHSWRGNFSELVHLKKGFPYNEIKLRVKVLHETRTVDDTVLEFSETRWILLYDQDCDTAYAIKELPFCGKVYDALAIKVVSGLVKPQNQKASLMEGPFRIRFGLISRVYGQKDRETQKSVLRHEDVCGERHHWRLGRS